jgi:hypothetical protein
MADLDSLRDKQMVAWDLLNTSHRMRTEAWKAVVVGAISNEQYDMVRKMAGDFEAEFRPLCQTIDKQLREAKAEAKVAEARKSPAAIAQEAANPKDFIHPNKVTRFELGE